MILRKVKLGKQKGVWQINDNLISKLKGNPLLFLHKYQAITVLSQVQHMLDKLVIILIKKTCKHWGSPKRKDKIGTKIYKIRRNSLQMRNSIWVCSPTGWVLDSRGETKAYKNKLLKENNIPFMELGFNFFEIIYCCIFIRYITWHFPNHFCENANLTLDEILQCISLNPYRKCEFNWLSY